MHFFVCRFNRETGLLGMSYAQFKNSEISPLTLTLLKVVHMLGLISMETGVGEKKDTIKMNNLTLINFVIKCIGPCHEQTLTLYMLGLQVSNYHFPSYLILYNLSLY